MTAGGLRLIFGAMQPCEGKSLLDEEGKAVDKYSCSYLMIQPILKDDPVQSFAAQAFLSERVRVVLCNATSWAEKLARLFRQITDFASLGLLRPSGEVAAVGSAHLLTVIPESKIRVKSSAQVPEEPRDSGEASRESQKVLERDGAVVQTGERVFLAAIGVREFKVRKNPIWCTTHPWPYVILGLNALVDDSDFSFTMRGDPKSHRLSGSANSS